MSKGWGVFLKTEQKERVTSISHPFFYRSPFFTLQKTIRFLFNCNIMEHTEIRVITWVLTKIVVN